MSTGFFYVKMNLIEWLLLAAATVLAFIPNLATGIAAIVIFSAVFVSQRKRVASQIPGQAGVIAESARK
jgi:TRAP-type uncharacterized transport system fused permease subunit